jgi:hypothetical protein
MSGRTEHLQRPAVHFWDRHHLRGKDAFLGQESSQAPSPPVDHNAPPQLAFGAVGKEAAQHMTQGGHG